MSIKINISSVNSKVQLFLSCGSDIDKLIYAESHSVVLVKRGEFTIAIFKRDNVRHNITLYSLTIIRPIECEKKKSFNSPFGVSG